MLGQRVKRQARQQEITSGFPDALDMMLVCVEAGQSLDQSILRVAKELRAGYPALADEFDIVGHEVKAGKVEGLKAGFRFATVPEIIDHFGIKPGYLGPIGTKSSFTE